MEKSILSIGLLSQTRPQVIDPYNNGQGTVLYNHNIVEVDVVKDEMGGITVTDDPTTANAKMFRYDSLRVEYPTTADNIFSTLLSAKYPANTESKLVNEYQSAVLGLLPDDSKKPYEAFLKDRLAIRNMVDSDCSTLNIPMDL
ncbi:MAG: hypothetical protein K2F71_01005 [Paramuribaculum sp.]|nr:hypothetical protein [Paramuribaculum sp.]